jgi:hypothetical protein
VIHWCYAFIDRPADRFAESCVFWERITQTRLSALRGERGEFATLLPLDEDAFLKTQAVGGAGGAHLDLCVRDMHELSRRAVQLGATVLTELDDVIVHRSPAGHLFCAVTWAGETAVPAPDDLDTALDTKTRVEQLCLETTPAHYETEAAFWAGLTGWELSSAGTLIISPAQPTQPFQLVLRQNSQLGQDTSQQVRAYPVLACGDLKDTARLHESLGATVVEDGAGGLLMRDPADGLYRLK